MESGSGKIAISVVCFAVALGGVASGAPAVAAVAFCIGFINQVGYQINKK